MDVELKFIQAVYPITQLILFLAPFMPWANRIVLARKIKKVYETYFAADPDAFKTTPDNRSQPFYLTRWGGLNEYLKKKIPFNDPETQALKSIVTNLDYLEPTLLRMAQFFDNYMYLAKNDYSLISEHTNPKEIAIVKEGKHVENIPMEVDGATAAEYINPFFNITDIQELADFPEIQMWIGAPFTTVTSIMARLTSISDTTIEPYFNFKDESMTYKSYLGRHIKDIEFLNLHFAHNAEFVIKLKKPFENYTLNYDRLVGSPSKLKTKQINLLKQFNTYIQSNYSYHPQLPIYRYKFDIEDAPFKFRTFPTTDSKIYKFLRTIPLGLSYYAAIIESMIAAVKSAHL